MMEKCEIKECQTDKERRRNRMCFSLAQCEQKTHDIANDESLNSTPIDHSSITLPIYGISSSSEDVKSFL